MALTPDFELSSTPPKKFLAETGKKIGQALKEVSVGLKRITFTVDDITVSFPTVRNWSPYSEPTTHTATSKNLPSKLDSQQPWLWRKLSGTVPEDQTIGLPIIISAPLTEQSDKPQEKFKTGRTTKKPQELVLLNREDMDLIKNPPPGTELVTYLEVAPSSPKSTHLHKLNAGIAAVFPDKPNTLFIVKNFDIETTNTAGTNGNRPKIDLSDGVIHIDDVAETLQAALTTSQFTVDKNTIYRMFSMAAALNTGVEDFWDTMHANQYFEQAMRLYPNVVALAFNVFLTSNNQQEALGVLHGFYNKIGAKECQTLQQFEALARQVVTDLPEGTSLSLNLGLGAIENLLYLTCARVANAKEAAKLIQQQFQETDSELKINGAESDSLNNPLFAKDPITTLFMTPRIISQFVQFAVERFIPAILGANEALYKSVEAGLLIQKSTAEALCDFLTITRESFEKQLPGIKRQLPAASQKTAQEIADAVVAMLNQAAEKAFGASPHIKSIKPPS